MIAAHQGRIDEARERSRARDRGGRGARRPHRAVGASLRARLHRALARRSRGRARVPRASVGDPRRASGCSSPRMRLELADTLEALIAVGDLEEAERKLVPGRSARACSIAPGRSRSPRARRRCSSLPRAISTGARGSLRARAGRARTGRGSVPARSHAARARRHAAAGEAARRRRATLAEALAAFERVGAPLWVEKARAELARIGGRAPSRDELTVAERRIAELVAEGRTNREVAAALFITEHTVEAALTRDVPEARDALARRARASALARGLTNCRGFQLSTSPRGSPAFFATTTEEAGR